MLQQSTNHMMDSDMKSLYQTLVFVSCNSDRAVNEILHSGYSAGKPAGNEEKKKIILSCYRHKFAVFLPHLGRGLCLCFLQEQW